jgi:hypothetical protein
VTLSPSGAVEKGRSQARAACQAGCVNGAFHWFVRALPSTSMGTAVLTLVRFFDSLSMVFRLRFVFASMATPMNHAQPLRARDPTRAHSCDVDGAGEFRVLRCGA